MLCHNFVYFYIRYMHILLSRFVVMISYGLGLFVVIIWCFHCRRNCLYWIRREKERDKKIKNIRQHTCTKQRRKELLGWFLSEYHRAKFYYSYVVVLSMSISYNILHTHIMWRSIVSPRSKLTLILNQLDILFSHFHHTFLRAHFTSQQ